mgnify:CR=1 FL=1
MVRGRCHLHSGARTSLLSLVLVVRIFDGCFLATTLSSFQPRHPTLNDRDELLGTRVCSFWTCACLAVLQVLVVLKVAYDLSASYFVVIAVPVLSWLCCLGVSAGMAT